MQDVFPFVLLLICRVCQGLNVTSENSTFSRGYQSGDRYGHTNRPPSGIHYLDFIDFEDPFGDKDGFRIYMKMFDSDQWKHIMKEATITVDDGYEIEKIQKQIEIDKRDRYDKRWLDFTKYSCTRNTQSITVTFHDVLGREKHIEIPNDLIFGREAIIARVEAVYPEDKIQLWTRNSAMSHCFDGGSVAITKNGRYLTEADMLFAAAQYTLVLKDDPGSECQDVQYDLAVTSRYGRDLGIAKIRREENRISLDLEGKVMTVNMLDVFLYCTSRNAIVTEVLGEFKI